MQSCRSTVLCLRPQMHWLIVALLLNLVVFLHDTSATNDSCHLGVITPGVTIPRGDIILEYGNPLRILCILNIDHKEAVGKNSSDISFFRNGKLVQQEFVTVVNSTTLELYVEEPPVSSSMYYCKLKTEENNVEGYTAICLNKVVVERKPQEVQNFSCISNNWQNLTCTWKKPHSYVNTTYDLSFRLPGRAGGRMHYKCPQIIQNETDGMCFWNIATDPHYRLPYEYYYFTLTGRNRFGNWTKQVKFHHYSHVIPAPATDLTIVNTSSSSAFLSWILPFPMQIFPPGIIQKLEYQSAWDSNDTWIVANTSTLKPLNESHCLFNLDGLKYANTLYDVRIYLKSRLAVGEDKWSAPTMTTFKTNASIPLMAPKTDIGSFEVSGGLPFRDVYIYWQRIPDHLKNGEGFEYKIISVEENGISRTMIPNETTNAYAKFRSLSYNGFKFIVASANNIGLSREKSVVYIPSKIESPPEPLSFTKIALGGGRYELSWKPPVDNNDRMKIEDYTIFWCDHNRDRPYQCSGFLNWTHVPRTETYKTIEVLEDRIYQFAISTNTKNASSGMVWASCTVIHNKGVGKMKSVWINRIGSNFIEVGWKLDCSDRIGTVQGFNIYYCPIVSPYNLSCKEDEMNTTVMGDPLTIHGNVTNLKPYTTYMVAIAVITQNGEGLQSDPLYNTTLEAAPVAPAPVNITEITNTSMLITWKPPKSLNGALRFYEVCYGHNKKKRIEMSTNAKPEITPMQTTLENLTSFYNYTVSVVACTNHCSEKSPPVTAQTAIGVPGDMEHPIAQLLNESMFQVSWKPPKIPGGHLDRYEVVVIKIDASDNKNDTHIFSVTGNECLVPVPDCESEGYLKYLFLVRAVNIGPNNVTYHGNWSSPTENNCYSSAIPKEVIVVIWVCGFIVFFALSLLFCYMGKRAWLKCKKMKDIEVNLPPGLKETEKEKDHLEFWPSMDNHDLITGKPRSNASADEELLLQKKEERHGRNPSGDSSGCSSGHESVSSSLTSGTQFSDSGTEVDQHPPSPEGVFPDSPTWESFSLRQRNVGSARPAEGDGVRWDTYVKMGKGIGSGSSGSVVRSTPNLTDMEGLSVGIGVGPGGPGTGYTCLGTWSSTGYISMPSSEEMGSGGIGLGPVVPGTGGYCRVGLDGRPAEGSNSQQQQQQQFVQPNKGYVSFANMIDTSPSTTPANSNAHPSPYQPSQQPLGMQTRSYVTHHPLWPISKETSAGKGYVMAGEVANKVPPTSGSLLMSEVEEENQGILDAELISGEEDEIEEGELNSPESYCRFGLRPSTIPMPAHVPAPSNNGLMDGTLASEQDRTAPKSGSGYVTLPNESRLPETKPAGGTSLSSQDSRRESLSGGTGGVANGYVPHRQFEKRDALALSQSAYQDYTKVFPPNICDSKKTPSTSV